MVQGRAMRPDKAGANLVYPTHYKDRALAVFISTVILFVSIISISLYAQETAHLKDSRPAATQVRHDGGEPTLLTPPASGQTSPGPPKGALWTLSGLLQFAAAICVGILSAAMRLSVKFRHHLG